MPRIPLSQIKVSQHWAIGALVIRDKPELLAPIGKCIAIWGQVDNEMGNLFSLLLGADTDAAVQVFLTIRRAANQIKAVQVAADHKLSGRDRQIFDTLMQFYVRVEEQRNLLAHGCYGYIESDPPALLWVSIRDHVHFQAETLPKLARNESTEKEKEWLRQRTYVYTLETLEALYQEMEDVWWAMFYFNCYLRDPHPAGKQIELEKLRQLPSIGIAVMGS